jgi:uncharacterized membrane protein YkvI
MNLMFLQERLNMKVRFLLVTGYLGAVIGAGFASGQEISQFFVSYGYNGLKGVILAWILFILCGAFLLYFAHEQNTCQYQQILELLLGKKTGQIIDVLLAVFLFVGISTMLSASGALAHEHFFLPKSLGILVSYAFILLILFSGRKGLFLSFYFLVPIKILLLLIITGLLFFTGPKTSVADLTPYLPDTQNLWPLSSLLYVAYNFALAMVVLTEYQSISSKRDGVIGAAWGGAILGLLVSLSYFALLHFSPAVFYYQVPMLYVAGNLSVSAKYIYTAVLSIGILTTAIANAYGVSQRIASFSKLNYRLCLFIVTTLALPLALQSFSTLVGRIYPLFGLLGLVLITALLFKAGKDLSLELFSKLFTFLKRLIF